MPEVEQRMEQLPEPTYIHPAALGVGRLKARRAGADKCGARRWRALGFALFTPACKSIGAGKSATPRSEEHTSELQSLMRISYAVFCLKNKKVQLHICLKLVNNCSIEHNILQ